MQDNWGKLCSRDNTGSLPHSCVVVEFMEQDAERMAKYRHFREDVGGSFSYFGGEKPG